MISEDDYKSELLPANSGKSFQERGLQEENKTLSKRLHLKYLMLLSS
jgi:hypothetical protein